jgi:tetratricopeptide (TPR) repeat protein
LKNQAIYAQGVSQIKAGRYEDGMAQLKKVPATSVYSEEVAQIIAQAGKNKAQQELAKARDDKRKNAEAAIAKALKYYAQGETKSSVSYLNRVIKSFNGANEDKKYHDRALSLKRRIEYSASLYRKGNSEFEGGQPENAINTWKTLLEVDQKITHRKDSYFSKKVTQKMADELSAKALSAFSDGDFPGAYKFTKRALNLQAKHATSLEVREMLTEKSKQLYREGYILEEYNPEKAVQKWKLILKISAPESEYYEKALRKIGTK